MIPTLAQAEVLLAEACQLNPGPWADHSRQVAEAARRIAAGLQDLDLERACILGLLHDIGRRAGVTGMRHVLDGFRYLQSLGYDEPARVCMTHSFPMLNVGEIFGAWDTAPEELDFIAGYLRNVELDDYDRLIQLCDSICMAAGPVLMEKRMMDVALRYGTNSFSTAKWRRTFEIKVDFERRLGGSIYDLLPGVRENTFRA